MSDVVAGSWSKVTATMNDPRAAAGAVVHQDKLYVAGGNNRAGGSKASLNTFESFDGTNWEALPSMQTARSVLGVGALGDHMYAVGGQQTDGFPIQSVEKFNPSYDCHGGVLHNYSCPPILWESVADMLTPRFGHGVGARDGILYAMGGYDGNEKLESVEAYDNASNTWSSAPSMPRPRWFFQVAALNDNLHAIGGSTGQGADLPLIDKFDGSSWTTLSAASNFPTAQSGFGYGPSTPLKSPAPAYLLLLIFIVR